MTVLKLGGLKTRGPKRSLRCVTHFVASLPDGRIFNDTLKRDQPFRFSLGAEEVLEGFDEGVATMREGERALLRLAPEVAYGAQGARDERGWQVPPDTTVAFDVRLLQVLKGQREPEAPQSEGRYSWERCGGEVQVRVPLELGLKVHATFREDFVGLWLGEEEVLQGVPGCKLEPEECYWELVEDGACVLLHLQKKGYSARWPDTLLK